MPKETSFVGRTYVLWKTEYESPAYVDQMGIGREGYRVLREVEVTVVEEKFAPGQISLMQNRRPYGLRAVAEDGEEFFNNWNSTADNCGPLGVGWYTLTDKKYVFFHDAYTEYNKQGIGFVTPEGERAIPKGIMICEKHGEGFAPRDEGTGAGCHECYLDTIVPIERPKAAASQN
jgi:hypothetical protein